MTLLDLRPPADRPTDDPRLLTNPFGQPVSSVFADLLPEEVRTKRRLRYLKRRMLFGLVALALIIGLGDTLARQQTTSASDDLATAQLRITALNHQAARYDQVVAVQSETQQITTLLGQAMAGDVPWAALTTRLQRLAPRGLVLAGLDGEVGTGNAAPQTTATGAPGSAVIGSLTLTGTAPSYQAVADYVDTLVALKGLTAVTPATVTAGDGSRAGITFSITASLTAAGHGGRYTTASASAPSSSGPTAPPASGSSAAASTPATARTPASTATQAAPTSPPVATAPAGN